MCLRGFCNDLGARNIPFKERNAESVFKVCRSALDCMGDIVKYNTLLMRSARGPRQVPT